MRFKSLIWFLFSASLVYFSWKHLTLPYQESSEIVNSEADAQDLSDKKRSALSHLQDTTGEVRAPSVVSTEPPLLTTDSSKRQDSHTTTSVNTVASDSVRPPWFAKVAEPEKLELPQIVVETSGLEGIENADLSEVVVRGDYINTVNDLYSGSQDKHAIRERVRLVELIEEFSIRQTYARAEVEGIAVEGTDEKGRSFVLLGFDEGKPVYSHTLNESSAQSTAASFVRQNVDFDVALGPDIDGSGFFFNINDHGIANQHLEFQLPNGGGSRVIEREVPDDDDHMDHVTGTVGAHGYRTDAKGMAPAVMMYSLNQQSSTDVALLGMTYPFQPRRSIGGTTSLGLSHSTGEGGNYTFDARDFDRNLRENPYYLHFYAAANNGGWDTLGNGRAMSKNLVTVTSGKHVNRDANGNYVSGGSLSSFSSRGPTDDGRIKPDITANGEGVVSTRGASSYASKQGTSMATPNASGSSILLQDYFSKRFPGHLMQSVSLKNLILHTADDLGDTGPDYRYGWGFMNTRKAADLIKNYSDHPSNRRMTEETLLNGETHTYTFEWDGSNPLVANLVWLDYDGVSSANNDDRVPDLKYDLDLRVVSPSGATFLPWAMPFVLNGFNAADFDTPAVKADNTTDNVEQVKVGTPPEAGIYSIIVSHKGSISSSDEVTYSLIVSGVRTDATASPPTITSFTPTEGGHHHNSLLVEGTGFLLGANVSLEAPGLPSIEAYGQKVTPTKIEAFLPLDRIAAGTYKVVVRNPDGQSVSSSTDFVVTAYTEMLSEDFDAPGFDFTSAGWVTGALLGTNDWTLSSTTAVSGRSAHVPTRTEEVHSYLESPPILIPNTSAPIKLSFDHQWDFEIELSTSWSGAAEGEDGALLMVSIDGGAFQYVDQGFTGDADGATIVSGDYWDNLDSSNPLKYSFYTTYAWTDESGGWQRTNVLLDASTYKNKTLRFRWVLGTQNKGTDNVEGWWIDNVALSVKADNVLPQLMLAPATAATVGQFYSEMLVFNDADGDPVALSVLSKPTWLSFADLGNGTGALSGTPSAGDVGTAIVTVEANDGTGTRSYDFALVVTPSGGNTPPAFTTTALDVAIIETPYSFTIEANDADGHALSLAVNGLPAWLSFTDNGDGTGTLSGMPNSYATGTVNLTATLSDGIATMTTSFPLAILPPAQISFASSNVSVGEGQGSVSISVQRSINSVGTVSVDYATADDTATAGSDYTATSGTLNWAEGDSEPKNIVIPILDDSVYNEVESFTVTLSNVSGKGELGAFTSMTVTIDDNDINLAPQITLQTPASNSISLPLGTTLSINTTVTDDGIFDPTTLTWSQVSGPSAAVFSATDVEDVTLSFPQNGDYLLRLTANDGALTSELNLWVKVGSSESGYPEPPTPLAYYPLDAASGTTANDAVGSNHATLTNGPAWSSGQRNGALSFDGTNDFAISASGIALSDTQGMSASAWVWWDGTPDVNILSQQDGSGTGRSILYITSDSKLGSFAGGSATAGTTTVTSGQWHHVALTAGSGTLKLYLNGVEEVTNALAFEDNNGKWVMGAHKNTTSKFWDGKIDEVAVYERVLTPTEIQQLNVPYSSGIGVNAGGPYTGMTGAPISINGTLTSPASSTWSLVSGPGSVSFGDASALATTATFTTAGSYTLRLTADNGSVTTFTDTSVTVNPSGPTVILVESDGDTSVTEGGATDSYSVVLGAEPGAEVTVTITSTTQVQTTPTILTFNASNWSSPQNVAVTAVDDTIVEGIHTAMISHTVTSADGDYDGMALSDVSITITDNDSYGELSLTSTSVTVGEAAGSLSLTVSRTGGSTGAVSVDYSTANDTATAGSDYTATNGTLNWADGELGNRTIVIPIANDTTSEASEQFTLSLNNVTGGATLGIVSTTLTIIDDDFTPASLSGLALWLKDADSNFDGTVWTDVSGNENHAAPVGLSGIVNYGAPTAITEAPAGGVFNGKSIPAVRFLGSANDLLKVSDLNGNMGLNALTMFVVLRSSGLDATSPENRIAGLGSRAGENQSSLTADFQLAGDGSLRYDNGNNLGSANPEDLHIRVARLDSGVVSSWIQDENGLSATITPTATPSGGTIPNPTRVDEFYLGDIGGGVDPNSAFSATIDADNTIAEVILYTTALTDEQVAAISDYLATNLGTSALLTPAETWRQTHFGITENSGNAASDADPDNDGLVNLLERALGGDPLQAASAPLPTLTQMADGVDTYLRLTVNRHSDATDLTYVVEVSADLVSWSSVEGTDIVTITNTANTLEVRDATPISPANPRRFLRLRVVE